MFLISCNLRKIKSEGSQRKLTKETNHNELSCQHGPRLTSNCTSSSAGEVALCPPSPTTQSPENIRRHRVRRRNRSRRVLRLRPVALFRPFLTSKPHMKNALELTCLPTTFRKLKTGSERGSISIFCALDSNMNWKRTGAALKGKSSI